ncbi:DUF4355 domain-containing protein [Mogibacterium diversum]
MLNELKKWELQLFADDGENVGGSDGVDKGNEPKESTPNSKEPDNKNAGDDVKKYTDADVNALIDKKFAKWQKDQEKKLAEAEKLAKMSEAEKREHELKELQEENERLKSQQTLSEMRSTASKLLKEKNVSATSDMLDFVATSDAEETKANIEKFVSIIEAAVKAAEVERNTGKTPKSYREPKGANAFEQRLAKYKKN